MSAETKNVVLLLYPDVEVLDFAGPFEVFSVAAQCAALQSIRVRTVAHHKAQLCTVGGLKVVPDDDFASSPQADVLLVPGGIGSRRAVRDEAVLAWLQRQAMEAEIVASICTGALLLGRLGLLDGLRATTHWGAIELLREFAPRIEVLTEARFVDNGKYLSSAGISAGIDMSLYLVSRIYGVDLAEQTAREMEYDWRVRQPG
ncbi:DJ-1/PfpI family protein [Dongia soli]|uniref:DJ-1/PfpI family protein n=1 Tax=Dongia soli TaxID=600628 RepID=A0ABU5EA16_9PROT|nr:DJ-1/PfpI family protein [Dongia soli]MDY0882711.1 DJ-1/PfpI family protein [Dongia soli]